MFLSIVCKQIKNEFKSVFSCNILSPTRTSISFPVGLYTKARGKGGVHLHVLLDSIWGTIIHTKETWDSTGMIIAVDMRLSSNSQYNHDSSLKLRKSPVIG